MKLPTALLASLMVAGVYTSMTTSDAARLTVPKGAPLSTWRELRAPHQIWPYDGAIYYSFNIDDGGSHAYLIVADTRTRRWALRPALAEPTTAGTSEIALKHNASAAVNGGYFNLKDGGASTSYITIDGQTVADPTNNKLLIENPKLKPFLPQIFNRSEVRFLTDAAGNCKVQIAKHSAPLPEGAKLVHALQAGPRLLPAVEAVDEAFIRKNADGTVSNSIGSKHPAARTAFGITPDGYAMILTVAGTGQDPESSGLSLDQVAALLKNLGCSEAINLDGGASTTMFVRLGTNGMGKDVTPSGTVVCGKRPETKVKSILMLIPSPGRKVAAPPKK